MPRAFVIINGENGTPVYMRYRLALGQKLERLSLTVMVAARLNVGLDGKRKRDRGVMCVAWSVVGGLTVVLSLGGDSFYTQLSTSRLSAGAVVFPVFAICDL